MENVTRILRIAGVGRVVRDGGDKASEFVRVTGVTFVCIIIDVDAPGPRSYDNIAEGGRHGIR